MFANKSELKSQNSNTEMPNTKCIYTKRRISYGFIVIIFLLFNNFGEFNLFDKTIFYILHIKFFSWNVFILYLYLYLLLIWITFHKLLTSLKMNKYNTILLKWHILVADGNVNKRIKKKSKRIGELVALETNMTKIIEKLSTVVLILI